MRRQHAARSERGQTWVGIAKPVFGLPRALPERHHAENLGEIFDDDLGTQLVEVEAVDQRFAERARAIEKEVAAVCGRRLGHDHVDYDLALGRQQRGECGVLRSHLRDIGGEQSVEEFTGVVTDNFDDAAIRQKCSLHEEPSGRA